MTLRACVSSSSLLEILGLARNWAGEYTARSHLVTVRWVNYSLKALSRLVPYVWLPFEKQAQISATQPMSQGWEEGHEREAALLKARQPRCALVAWWALSGPFLPQTLGPSHDRSSLLPAWCGAALCLVLYPCSVPRKAFFLFFL